MSFTYTKLSSDILFSSVWCEPMPTKIVWITLLAMADQYGRVGASVPGVAKAAGVSVEEAQTALEKFLSPDPFSRTPDHEGRRIEVIERGWRLLNYEKRRAQKDDEHQRRRHAKNQAAYRERQKEKVAETVTVTDHVTESDPKAEAEAEAKSIASQLAVSPASQEPEPGASLSAHPRETESKPANSQPVASKPAPADADSGASEPASEPQPPTPFDASEGLEFIEQLASLVEKLVGAEQDVALENKETSRLESLTYDQDNIEKYLNWALKDGYWRAQMVAKPNEAMKVFIRAFETIRKQALNPLPKKKTGKVVKNPGKTASQKPADFQEVAAKPLMVIKTGEFVTAIAMNRTSGEIKVRHQDGRESVIHSDNLQKGEE